jgi:hypothetical protein
MMQKLLYNLPVFFLKSKKIAMFHTGRCGSTVLANLINQNYRIFWDGEVYEKYRKSSLPVRHITSDLIKIIKLRSLFVGRFYGFEVKLNQDENDIYVQINSDLKKFIRKLYELGFTHFIILSRRNYLRQIVSGAIGFETRKWQLSHLEKPKLTRLKLDLENVPYGYDSKSLLTRFREFDTTYNLLNDLLVDQNILRLTYEEDILKDPKIGYERVCNFLGVNGIKVTVNSARMNPFNLSEIIANFREVEGRLTGTRYQWMLYDPLYE